MQEKGLKPKVKAEYYKFLKMMGEVFMEEALQRGIVGLPWRNGIVMVKKNRFNANQKDVRPSIGYENNKKVVKFNEHTDGQAFFYYWLSYERSKKKKSFWSFSTHRDLARSFAKALLSGKRYPDFSKLYNIK
jgi:hypothetical protein